MTMNITIQRLPDGRLQAYGEDLEAMRECIVGDAESVAERLAEVCKEAMPYEKRWEPALPDPDVAVAREQRNEPSLHELMSRGLGNLGSLAAQQWNS